MSKIYLIVEGDGDMKAVPLLVRRILEDHGRYEVQLAGPQRSGDVRKSRQSFERFMRYALKEGCPVLWVLDCDDKHDGELGCPVRHVEHFQAELARLQLHPPQLVEFAFFVREFESLFLAEQNALKSYYQLPETLVIDAGAATRRNAKGEISRLLDKSRAYKETTDQTKITHRLDLTQCREVSRDFRHLEDAVLRLCAPPQ